VIKNPSPTRTSPTLRAAVLLAALSGLAACATPSSGPSTGRIVKAGQNASPALANVQVIDLTDNAVQRAAGLQQRGGLLEQLGDAAPFGTIVGRGDTIEVSIWEAPPAVLYGTSTGVGSGIVARSPGIPEQVVDASGQISVPFVGRVNAAGRSPNQIAAEIEARLQGKAHAGPKT
jgi:polysaccharide biosynthesis/export protein